jgi:two-component system, OmpR family, phosphate regulon response regulator PhoB
VPATDRWTVLIVEDEPPLRELVRVSLGDDDHDFAEAGDGVSAAQLARQLLPDLVVLDLMLPLRSGLEVLEEIRSDARLAHTRVVVITASSNKREEVLAAGADRFIRKPFDPVAFRQTVEELLAER